MSQALVLYQGPARFTDAELRDELTRRHYARGGRGQECPACRGFGLIADDPIAMARATRIDVMISGTRNALQRLAAANKILEEGQLEHLTDEQLQAEADRIIAEIERRKRARGKP